MLEEGRLPQLARLLARSSYGQLDTMPNSYSPAVWATIATGLPIERHGISGFLRFHLPGVSRPISRGPQLHAFKWWGGANHVLAAASRMGWVDSEPQPSTQRRGHTLWNVAAARGHSIGVYDWLTT